MRLVPRSTRSFKSSFPNSESTIAALRTTRARPEPEFNAASSVQPLSMVLARNAWVRVLSLSSAATGKGQTIFTLDADACMRYYLPSWEGGPRRSRKTRQGCDALAVVIRPHAVLAQLLSARGKWSG